MAQYGVVTKEVLQGDEGCYLLPLEDTTGYVEAALVEPWACVVAAYEYPNYRDGLLDGGRLLIVSCQRGARTASARGAVLARPSAGLGRDRGRRRRNGFRRTAAGRDGRARVSTTSSSTARPTPEDLARDHGLSGPARRPEPGARPAAAGHRPGRHRPGALRAASVRLARMTRPKWRDAYTRNTRKELLPGGKVWLVGAGGPMGQMHIQRAVMLDAPPSLIVVSDRHDDRLERIRARFGRLDAGARDRTGPAERQDRRRSDRVRPVRRHRQHGSQRRADRAVHARIWPRTASTTSLPASPKASRRTWTWGRSWRRTSG